MKFKPITSVFLHVTNACNCVCRYCFESPKPDYIKWETAVDVVNYLIENAKHTGDRPGITFFGGEPMLMYDEIIKPLVQYVRLEYALPFDFSITSNCTLMTEERLKFLKKEHVGLLFSIDGDKETQNYNRPMKNGTEAWGNIKDIIPLIVKYFPNVCFRSTVIPQTAHNVFHNIMFAQKSGFNNFYITPNTLQAWTGEEKHIFSTEVRKYSDYIVDCLWHGENFIRLHEYSRNFQRIMRINNSIKNNIEISEDRNGAFSRCGLGTNRYAAIAPNGDIYGCQEFVSSSCPDKSFENDNPFMIGNIYTGIDESRRKRLACSYSACSKNGLDCKNCRLNRVCNGGCVANNYYVTHDVKSVAPMYCWWAKLLLDEAIYVCNQMGENPPPAFLNYWEESMRDKYE